MSFLGLWLAIVSLLIPLLSLYLFLLFVLLSPNIALIIFLCDIFRSSSLIAIVITSNVYVQWFSPMDPNSQRDCRLTIIGKRILKIALQNYLKFVSSIVINNVIEKPQCVLCNAVLGAESKKPKKPSKLKCHLETKHSKNFTKDLKFLKRYEAALKEQKLDFTETFQQQSQAVDS